MIVLIALIPISLAAIVVTVVQVCRDGYRRAPTRPNR
jgi:hypothetical protein